MSRLRGHGPEAPNPTYDRGLTARPVVLAKRSEPGHHTSRPTVDGPGRTFPGAIFSWVFPELLVEVEPSGNSSSFDASPPTRRGRGLNPVPPVGFGAVERLVGRLQDVFGIRLFGC